jgi:phosphoribosylformylglycinamidine synthase
MEPWEVLMSESQERMLLVAERGQEREVISVFERWGLNAVVIGEVTGDGMLTSLDGGRMVACVRAETLAAAPRYDMPAREPAYLAASRAWTAESVPVPDDLRATLLTLLAAPNLCSRRWVWEQYDSTVQTNTVAGPGGDAAVLRVKEAAPRGLSLAMDGNSRRCYLDPYEGARQTVAEAARNVSCAGGEPVVVTDGLNFGSPDEPERYWQFRECVRGLADACRDLDLAVVSGNVSFYNESPAGPIFPTPIVGVLGTVADVHRHATPAFKRQGDAILLLGEPAGRLEGSEYLSSLHGIDRGAVAPIDLAREASLQALVRGLISDGVVDTAHDLSDGGLAVALAEMCLAGNIGAIVRLPEGDARIDARLFGEAPSRIILALPGARLAEALAAADAAGVPHCRLGETGGEQLAIAGALEVSVGEMREAHERTLPQALSVVSR